MRTKIFMTSILWATAVQAQEPIDRAWYIDTNLIASKELTDADLGAAQGVAEIDGKLYIYGDLMKAQPRVGIIKEYTTSLVATGRKIMLTDQGKVVAFHPTGLTQDPQHGTFLGDTVSGKGKIYKIDWDKALRQGTLDNAVLATIIDDAAVNGTRPEFVRWKNKTYLATSDYGDLTPTLRLYDPKRLVETKTSRAAMVSSAAFIPFTQTLAWDKKSGTLMAISNVVAGLGWRLESYALDQILSAGNVATKGALLKSMTLPPHDELEGAIKIEDQYLFVTSSSKRNLVVGRVAPIRAVISPAGTMDLKVNQ